MRALRPVRVGSTAGAVIGAAFALAVISFADCAGPRCAGERVVGLVGHAAGGAVLGAAIGLLALALRQLARRVRGGRRR